MEYTFRCFQDGDSRENNLVEMKAWKEKIGEKIDMNIDVVITKKGKIKKGKIKKVKSAGIVKYVGEKDGMVIVEITDKKINKYLQEQMK